MRGEQFLKTTDEKYDFAFIDTVKREYSGIWQLLRPRLNKNACVIFDDIFNTARLDTPIPQPISILFAGCFIETILVTAVQAFSSNDGTPNLLLILLLQWRLILLLQFSAE